MRRPSALKKLSVFFATVSAFSLFAAAAWGNTVIKFATVAPEGSSWMVIMKEAAAEVKAKTGNRVSFKIYPGGIAGDEPDVIRKMRIGQYHGAGFTGVGMGEILPESRIVELPYLFHSPEEIDYLQARLTPYLEQRFREKGFEFISWGEPGLVYFMSQKPIRSSADLQGTKMWVWEGDVLGDAVLKAFKISPVPIALPDVLMSLQTGMINTVYAPPLAALALQWNTKVKYLLDEPITNSTGVFLIAGRAWEKIVPQDQKIVKDVMKVHLVRLAKLTRKQNQESIEKFRQMGIKVVKPDQKGREEMMTVAHSIWPKLAGKLYSAELLKQVEGHLAEYRRQAKTAARKP